MDLTSQKPAKIFLPWQDVPQISKELGIHQSTAINGAVICGCRGRSSQHPKKTQIVGVLQINSRWYSSLLGLMPLSSVVIAVNGAYLQNMQTFQKVGPAIKHSTLSQ